MLHQPQRSHQPHPDARHLLLSKTTVAASTPASLLPALLIIPLWPLLSQPLLSQPFRCSSSAALLLILEVLYIVIIILEEWLLDEEEPRSISHPRRHKLTLDLHHHLRGHCLGILAGSALGTRMFADRRISSRVNLDHKCRSKSNLTAISSNVDP